MPIMLYFFPHTDVCSVLVVRTHVSSSRQVAANFRKTATNFHYEFNIRHLSNVFQGLLVSRPDQFKTAEKFVHLWMHESERVYGDRLVMLTTKKISASLVYDYLLGNGVRDIYLTTKNHYQSLGHSLIK